MPDHSEITNGFSFGSFSLDRNSGNLYGDGILLKRLRSQELKALLKLLEQAPALVTNDELKTAVWGEGATEPLGGVKGIVSELRDALGPHGHEYIENIKGSGYRFVVPVHIIQPRGIPRWLLWTVLLVVVAVVLVLRSRKGSSPVPTRVAAVSIDSPVENEKVPLRRIVKGQVIPGGNQVCVFIHPEGTDGYYRQPNLIATDDTWRVDAYFGEAGKDIGLSFQVMAFIGCKENGSDVLTKWPEGTTAHSKMVTVIRR